jgi:hypothetical protein
MIIQIPIKTQKQARKKIKRILCAVVKENLYSSQWIAFPRLQLREYVVLFSQYLSMQIRTLPTSNAASLCLFLSLPPDYNSASWVFSKPKISF